MEVLVWIHGGFLHWGSGHDPGICPSGRVAKRLNSVFVSFNYRLGPLGFMALDILSTNPQDARGNYGLWDQIVALEWVKHNIRAFGGDPEKVFFLKLLLLQYFRSFVMKKYFMLNWAFLSMRMINNCPFCNYKSYSDS